MNFDMLNYNLPNTQLKGTTKQIAWAEKIRIDLIEQINEKSIPHLQHLFQKDTPKIREFKNRLQSLQTNNDYLNNQVVIHQIRSLIAEEENAVTFIENQSLLSFLKTILNKG